MRQVNDNYLLIFIKHFYNRNRAHAFDKFLSH